MTNLLFLRAPLAFFENGIAAKGNYCQSFFHTEFYLPENGFKTSSNVGEPMA